MSPGKLPIQIEACIPDQNANNPTTGPCIINGAGASKLFQILYRNEEVALRDVIMFRAHLLGEIIKQLFLLDEIITEAFASFMTLQDERVWAESH